MKNKSGITLIALVITIIVMLILVAVTVNVAMNGGLFSQAQTAKWQTDTEVKKEQITSVLVGAINDKGELTVENIKGALKKKLEIEDADIESTEFPLIVTYKGEKFEIESNGVVNAKEENETTNPETEMPNPENSNNDTLNEYGFYSNKAYIVTYDSKEETGPLIFIVKVSSKDNVSVSRYLYNNSTNKYEIYDLNNEVAYIKRISNLNWQEIGINPDSVGEYTLLIGDEIVGLFSKDGTTMNACYELDLEFDISQLSN